MRKHAFSIYMYMQKQRRRSAARFVFATLIVQYIFFLNPKFQINLNSSYVVVQLALCRTWSETPKTSFLASRLITKHVVCCPWVVRKVHANKAAITRKVPRLILPHVTLKIEHYANMSMQYAAILRL